LGAQWRFMNGSESLHGAVRLDRLGSSFRQAVLTEHHAACLGPVEMLKVR
jgi:hypothetical protein